jgi:hypothetical protein
MKIAVERSNITQSKSRKRGSVVLAELDVLYAGREGSSERRGGGGEARARAPAWRVCSTPTFDLHLQISNT